MQWTVEYRQSVEDTVSLAVYSRSAAPDRPLGLGSVPNSIQFMLTVDVVDAFELRSLGLL